MPTSRPAIKPLPRCRRVEATTSPACVQLLLHAPELRRYLKAVRNEAVLKGALALMEAGWSMTKAAQHFGRAPSWLCVAQRRYSTGGFNALLEWRGNPRARHKAAALRLEILFKL